LDEILAVGDQHFQAKCWRRLRDRVSRGASGVLVTHDWSAIVKLCETAHVVEKGRVIFSGAAERAARRYLYGEVSRETFRDGVARFVQLPAAPVEAVSGQDLLIDAEAELLIAAEVSAVFVIERLQPGYGWETVLMSRAPAAIGQKPGRYKVQIRVPHLPLDAGSYQINLHLVMPDPDLPGRRIALDGRSWLNGDGLALDVAGPANQGLALPASWTVTP
jgi:lipopolysaccharide transport system ATP-binding protein